MIPQFLFALVGVLGSPLAEAHPIISEFSSDGETVMDEEGTATDWIELFNPDAVTVNLSGWHLSDSADNLVKWAFPSVTLPPGGFLVIYASGKHRTNPATPLHTNFALERGGGYLALVRPDGTTKATEFLDYPSLGPDETFGYAFSGTILVARGASGRALVPANGSMGATWQAPGFADSDWTAVTTGVGFLNSVPGFAIQQARSSTTISNLAGADAVLAGTNRVSNYTGFEPVINFVSGGNSDVHFGGGKTFPGGSADNFALKATATVVIPSSEQWTFGISTDDGGRLKIDGVAIITDNGQHAPEDRFATLTLTAGPHALEFVHFESGFGEEAELFAAPGAFTSFHPSMRLVGDTVGGGLFVSAPQPGATLGGLVQSNIEVAMRNVNASAYLRLPFTSGDASSFEAITLKMRYNDGFTAFLNGNLVASRNAPAPGILAFNSTATSPRMLSDIQTAESFNLRAFQDQLIEGANVLAVHGLNISAADDSFLLLPELEAADLPGGAPVIFHAATAGAPNIHPGFPGVAGDTHFSVHRGFFAAPFEVTVTCNTPGATIRYTSDGSTPTESNGTAVAPLDSNTPPGGTVTINRTTVLRARAFKSGLWPSNTDTQTYLFPDDVITQSLSGAPPPGWPASTVNGQVLDYGMDPEIVNHADPNIGGVPAVKAALMAIPTVSVVTDQANLTDPQRGIYVNAREDGIEWERAVSVEMLNDASGGFHANCGLRIRGGFSRNPGNPKHAFRVLFRDNYGEETLRYPLFGEDGANSFDKFDLQCPQNYSWSFEYSDKNTFLRELWCRDTAGDLGQPHTRGKFVHLYLNGIYWGLYQIQERPEANFAATYLGGNDDDYDVIKVESGTEIAVTDGVIDAWQELWTKARAHAASPTPANYFKIFGLAADGITPTADPVLLDLDAHIDYLLGIYYGGNADAPISSFTGNTNPNNFYSLRRRTANRGFVHIDHDGEHTLGATGANVDRTGPFNSSTKNNFSKSNPQFLHEDLLASPAYKRAWQQRVYDRYFNGGPLSTARNIERLEARALQIDAAIIAESARWGDARRPVSDPPRTKATWTAAKNAVLAWMQTREANALAQLKADGLNPAVDPPLLFPRGGNFGAGPVSLAIANPNIADSTVYYTTDGSDPLDGGGIALETSLFAVPEFSNGAYLVPVAGNQGDTLTLSQWTRTEEPTNAEHWASAQMGVGYSTGTSAAAFAPFIKTNVEAAMRAVNATIYLRIPFTLGAAEVLRARTLTLQMRYDDGYVAYLNGTQIAARNAPGLTFFNSAATSAHSDIAAVVFENVDVTAYLHLLQPGANMLAIRGLNSTISGSDALFSPQLKAGLAVPIEITSTTTLKTRTLAGTEWSALNEATFVIGATPASAQNLVVSEIHYHPADPSTPAELAAGNADSDFEFIELMNISTGPIDLTNVRFGDGIEFDFSSLPPSQRTLGAGARIVLVENSAAFQARYGTGVIVTGQFEGSLANGGERLALITAEDTIHDFTYDDVPAWPAHPDGGGSSLVLIAPQTNPNPSNPENWRSSITLHGTPGGSDAIDYSAWKFAHGVTEDAGDDDADGMNNFLEYAVNGDPRAPSSLPTFSLSVAAFSVDGVEQDYPQLSISVRLGADEARIVAQTSADLSTWSDAGAVFTGEMNEASGLTVRTWRSISPIAAPGRQFMRLRIGRR
ncbi:MAG: lamin tail domain-containing protein [Verrucomicrobiales bacterium]